MNELSDDAAILRCWLPGFSGVWDECWGSSVLELAAPCSLFLPL